MGKKALVCGASKGIGRSVAKALAFSGADVIAVGRTESLLQQLKTEVPSGRLQAWAQDLSDHASLKANLNAQLERLGEIHIVINNTAGPKGGPLVEADVSELTAAFAGHVGTAHLLMQALVPGMKRAKYGRIINIISTSVKVPLPNLGVSNTVRGAMANWAKTLAMELGPFGITVNNVLPGFTATDRLESLKAATAEREKKTAADIEAQWLKTIPAGRFASPDETAQAVLFLASANAAYINGINLPVDGGRTGSL